MKNTPSRWLYIVPVLLLGVGTRAPAQSSDTTPPAKDKVVELAKYVVTGSNLPTAADSTEAPVVVIGQQEIEKTGVNSSLLEILRKSIPAFAGRSNTGVSNATNTNQNTAGGSSIALRNLDTLILINGRRIAMSGSNALGGGKNFVDINQIPVAAIDHVEVLTDGASAIYGSDAIGGVVNIILKSDYKGAEIGGRYAISSDNGHYSERSGYFTAGVAQSGVSITASVTWSKTDPLYQSERNFISNNPKTGVNFPGFAGGNYLAPALATPSSSNPVGINATASSYAALVANGTYLASGSASIPLFQASPYITMLMATEKKGAVVSGTVDIVKKKLVAFGDAMFSRTDGANETATFNGNIRTGVTVPAGSPFNPLNVAATGVSIGYLDLPLKTRNHATGTRASGGLRGEISPDWNWEVGVTSSTEKVTQFIDNNFYLPNQALAIAGGYNAAGVATPGGAYSRVIDISSYPAATNYVIQPALDPFARSGENPASLANVFGTQQVSAVSKLTSFDAKIVGMPVDLPAGKLAFAVGAAARKESLDGTPDKDSYTLANFPLHKNWAAGLAFDPFSKSRTVDAVFAEVRVPIASASHSLIGANALDISFAGREERYSDAGSSNVPKIGIRWQPFDEQFSMRFTYSKAFAAPDMAHMFAPANATQTSSSTFFATNLPANPLLNRSFIYFSGNGNNPDLKPSKAWTRNIGFSYSPKQIKGLTIQVDYSDLFYKGLPAGIGGNNIIASVNALGSASPYFSAIAIGGLPGQPGSSQTLLASPGGLSNYLTGGSYNNDIYITDHFVNSGGIHIEAFDIRPEYRINTATMGTWTIGITGTYLESYLYQTVPTASFYQYAGYSTNGQTIAGSMPNFSFYTSLDWKYRNWETVVGNSYSSSMTDIGSTPPAVYLATRTPVRVDPYYAWDLQEGYTFDKVETGRLWSTLSGMKITVGINNVFNRMPPYAGLSQAAGNNNNNADVAQYSPIGRLFYFTATLKY